MLSPFFRNIRQTLNKVEMMVCCASRTEGLDDSFFSKIVKIVSIFEKMYIVFF